MQRQSKRAPEGVLLLLLFFLFPSFDKPVKKLAGGYVKQLSLIHIYAAAAKAARVTRIHKTVITPVRPPLSATLPSMGETTPPTLEARPIVMPEARPKWLGTNFWPKATEGLKAILRETAAGTSMKVTKAGFLDLSLIHI